MALYVHIADECAEEARDDRDLESRLSSIRSQVQTAQNLSGFSFLSPAVLKKKIGRQFRLIVRQHELADDKLIIFLRLLQRHRADYSQILEAIKKGPSPYSHDEIRSIHANLAAAEPVAPRPVPSDEERAWLYEVLPETPTNDTFVFETRLWVNEMRGNQLAPLYHKLLEEMIDLTSLEVSTRHDYWPAGTDLGISYYFRRDLNSILLLSPLRRDLVNPKLDEYARLLSDVGDRTGISRLAARSYPLLVVLDRDAWLDVQNDEESNLALSPEESQIINSLHETGTGSDIGYPLFINGLAGSGKSTILQYLASAYVDFALRRSTRRLPLYLTASDDLLTRARQIVKGLLTTNHEQVIKDKIDQRAIDRLLTKSFRTFHQLLYSLLSSDRKDSLRSDRHVNYASFRRLWHQKFTMHQRADQLSVEVSWHIIRSLIKGIRSDSNDELAPEDYEELPRRRRSVSLEDYKAVYDLVWEGWYKPLCETEGYWDDQDLAAFVLGDGAASREDRAAIFCDEAQDFTAVELDVIFQLSLYGRRTLQPFALRRVPIIFAGDPLQTINPTGFRWDAVKADFHDRFQATLGARSTLRIDMSYRDLRFNYRSNAGIVRFCNLVQLARAALLNRVDIRPQDYWWREGAVSPTWFLIEDPGTANYLRDHPEFVKLVDCHEGEETEYVKRDRTLRDALVYNEGTYGNVIGPTRAKGLEFSAVVLYRFGERMASDFDRLLGRQLDLEDPQIRLRWEYFFSRLYVAASRARDRLIVVDSNDAVERFWKFATDPDVHDVLLAATGKDDVWSGTYAPPLGQLSEAWDLGTHIDQRAQAEQYATQGKRDGDPYLLRQAGLSYSSANEDTRAQVCFAQATELEENWKSAGDRYCKLHLHEDALRCYWRGKLWTSLKQLATIQTNYVGRLELRAVDFMATGVGPSSSFLERLHSTFDDETRLQEIASDPVWPSVLATAADRAAASKNLAVSWSDLFRTFDRLECEGVHVSKSSLATFAFRCRNYEKAAELWLADGRTQHAEYRIARSYLTPFPECIELFRQPGDNAEILRQWNRNQPPDTAIRTLPARIAYMVTDAALAQDDLGIAVTIMHAHPHRERVGRLLSTAVRVRNSAAVYEAAIVAARMFVRDGAWSDVAESLSSISELAAVPIDDIRSALQRKGNSDVVLETIISELATSDKLAHDAPREVAAFLHRIKGTIWRDLSIPAHVVGAAIERAGRIRDALQYYNDLLQHDRDDLRRFAAERLVRNHERYAHYFETTRNMQQAHNQYNIAKQMRKKWDISDSNLDEFPKIRTELRSSLRNPHPETRMFAETGEAEWFAGLPDGDEDLIDPAAGQAVRWIPGEGWVEE